MTPELIRALTPCIGIISGTLILIAALASNATGERLTIASAIATASISGSVGLAQQPVVRKDGKGSKSEDD